MALYRIRRNLDNGSRDFRTRKRSHENSAPEVLQLRFVVKVDRARIKSKNPPTLLLRKLDVVGGS